MAIEPNPYPQPTTWNFNPLLDTSNIINYDGDNEYDATQPYDGMQAGQSNFTWKNPTAYQSSLVAGATQQYYGGPSTVPLYAGPTSWFANATPDNESGQYDPENNAYSDLWPYDGLAGSSYADSAITYGDSMDTYGGSPGTPLVYDADDRNYDGQKDDMSFENWKNPTSWSPITPGSL